MCQCAIYTKRFFLISLSVRERVRARVRGDTVCLAFLDVFQKLVPDARILC